VKVGAELNPFNFSRPAPAGELIDRELELENLLRLAEGNSNCRLTAPRRYGKTTLLKRVREEAERFGMNTVYVNFYGLLSIEEAANRIEDAYRASLHGPVRNLAVGLIRTFRPKATIPKTGVSIEPTLNTDVGRRLAWLLDLPVKIMEKTGNPTLVVFDEFQDILETKPPLDGLIRSRLEQHETHASYIFAGSHIGMMSRLFDDKARPFYGQARAIRLEPLPEDALAVYIGERFTRTHREVGEMTRRKAIHNGRCFCRISYGSRPRKEKRAMELPGSGL
jgi:AAA+ ATPase superfamily predicted ATPase